MPTYLDNARRVAQLWLATAAGTPLWKSMLRYSIPQGVTLKADAKADEHGIGIGGWLSVEAQPSRGSAFWFAYQLKHEDFSKESRNGRSPASKHLRKPTCS